jgi:PAS domain S-box-containing protein
MPEHDQKSPDRWRETGAEARLLQAIDSVRDYAIFLIDVEGRVSTWNAGAEAVKGYRLDEIRGKSIELFYTPEDRARRLPQELLAQARANGRVESEGWRVRKDGSRFWADVVLTAVHDSNRELIGYAKVTRDLTDRRAVAEALQQSETRLRLLIETVKDHAIFMLDPAGSIVSWNSGAQRIKGYSAAEIIGRPLSTFYTEIDIAQGKPTRDLELATVDGRYEEEGWRVRKDGTQFWASVVIAAMRDDSGRLIGFAEVTGDLTERRRREEERVKLAHAEEAVRLRDEFLLIASHELNTPLAAMQLQLESVRARVEGVDPALAQRLGRATRSGERLANLIATLLDVSRIVSGNFELHRELFELGEALADVTERLREAAGKAGCVLTVVQDSAAIGTWDRLRIEQIITNLVSNGIKYAAGTPITITVKTDATHAILEVNDRGPGIGTADLSRIFDRFERATSVRHYSGLGLGLYVTRQIAEGHGGSVAAGNREGGGASFVVRLPLSTALEGTH